MGVVDWVRIKNEYINTDISYRKLAEKHGVSFRTLANKAKNENWVRLKQKQRDKIDTKLSQKTAEKRASAEARRIERVLNITDVVLDKIQSAVEQLETDYKDGETIDTGIVNTARLRQIVQSLKDIKDIGTADGVSAENNDVIINITEAVSQNDSEG